MIYQTPVLLITFNRPEYTRQVIEQLRKCEVENLYIFKDGPRPGNEEDVIKSQEIERLIEEIDWKCHVRTMYMCNNLGCGFGPYSAISWAFGFEEELVILEDDCVPSKAFFEFCNDMLLKYRNNKDVSLISGRCHLNDLQFFKDSDYIFTQFAPTWGWATWRRSWQNFDIQMRNVEEHIMSKSFLSYFGNEEHANFFVKRFRRDIKDKELLTHAWDLQFGYHSRMKGQLRISPAKNLICYVGLYGTHFQGEMNSEFEVDFDESFKALRHPQERKVMVAYENAYFERFVRPVSIRKRIINRIKRLFI